MSNSSQTLECPKITIFSDVLTTLSGPFESPRSQGPVFFQLKKTPFHHDLAASQIRPFLVESILLRMSQTRGLRGVHLSLFAGLELIKQRRRQVTQMPRC